MLVIGLTGGIGSGKTTVANLFAEKGIDVIDTDVIARELTLPGREAIHKIAKHFGQNILQADGTLNRKLLRTLVFSDANHRLWLEQLLHPLIRIEMELQVTTAKSPYCIAIIPLLFETKWNSMINRILVVDASREAQIARTRERDSTTLEEIEAILDAQVTREHRLAHATDMIHNDGSLEDLTAQVDKLHELYLSLAGA